MRRKGRRTGRHQEGRKPMRGDGEGEYKDNSKETKKAEWRR